jgi:hypothetical protein
VGLTWVRAFRLVRSSDDEELHIKFYGTLVIDFNSRMNPSRFSSIHFLRYSISGVDIVYMLHEKVGAYGLKSMAWSSSHTGGKRRSWPVHRFGSGCKYNMTDNKYIYACMKNDGTRLDTN